MNLPTCPAVYEALLNEPFLLVRPDLPPLEFKLVDVTRKIADDIQDLFFVRFEGPSEFVPQGLYCLRHVQLEIVDILLVPTRRTKTGFLYDATFNLLKPAS